VNNFCLVGEELFENLHVTEVSAWKATDSLTHRASLMGAEKALLAHSQNCERCNPALHQHFLQ
jgi:hypothetical protein